MTLVRKTLPLLPLDGRELLSAVREDSEDELDLAEGYLYAAQAALYSQVRRAAHRTQFELTLPCFPSNYDSSNNFDVPYTRHEYAAAYIEGIELRVLPYAKVDSIQYYDADNALQTWTASNYTIIDGGVDRPATIYPAPDVTWPATKARPDAVVVTFWAGEVTQATYLEVAPDFVGTDAIQTVDGYTFAVDDIITVSHSANNNEVLGPVGIGFGTTARQDYHITYVSGDTFEIALTNGGTPIALSTPVASTAFVGTLSPLVRRVLLSVATNWWMNRCPLEDCSCETNEAGKIAGLMSLLQWNHGHGN